MPISIEQVRDLFPAAKNTTYFANNGLAPMPTPVTEAIRNALDGLQGAGVAAILLGGPQVLKDARAKTARLLGCDPDEVTFARNTGEGIVWTADSIRWQPGDEVLVYQGEYPTVVYPFMMKESEGVKTVVRPMEERRVTPQMVERDLTRRTRLLAISFVQFDSGFRPDLKAISAVCRANGTLLLVDAIQGLGALPLNVRDCDIDFLAAGTHKWLWGLQGLGVYYVRRELLPDLRPVHIALGSMVHGDDPEYPNQEYIVDVKKDASRFEEGSHNYIGLVALNAALDLIFEIGVENIAGRIKEITDFMLAGAVERGGEVVSPRGPNEWSGIIMWRPPARRPAKEIVPAMHQQLIVINEREDCVHAGINAYNNEEDVTKVLRFLD
jgi:cysteine desulfurase/selenocysteine lyase